MTTALLLVDMINEFAHPQGKLPVAGAMETIPRLAEVLTACRDVGLPTIHVVREHRSDGSNVESVRREKFWQLGGFCLPGSWGVQVVSELAPLPEEIVVAKHGWSAFFDTDLQGQLQRLGIDTLVIGGTQTPNCIRATVYEATALGYDVLLLGDGTSSATPEVQSANLGDLTAIGVSITDCASFIDQVREKAAAPPRPRARLCPVRPQEWNRFTRLVLETIRQGDQRLDSFLRLPLLAWWTRRSLHQIYHHRSRPLLLEVGGETAGVLVLRHTGDALRIEALGVLPAYRRQGWGQWLLQQAEQEARQQDLRRLELEVAPGNRPALDLYWQEGFRPIPRRWGALWLERALSTEKTP